MNNAIGLPASIIVRAVRRSIVPNVLVLRVVVRIQMIIKQDFFAKQFLYVSKRALLVSIHSDRFTCHVCNFDVSR